HGGKECRFKGSEAFKHAFGLRSARRAVGERTLLKLKQCLTSRADDIGGGNRSNVSGMEQDVGTKQSARSLFEQNPGVPSIRSMGGRTETEAVLSRGQDILRLEDARRANRKIIHVEHGAK